MANDFGCALSHDDRLKEMNFGDWETQRWDEIDRALLDEWAANFEHARAHGGDISLTRSDMGGLSATLRLPRPA